MKTFNGSITFILISILSLLLGCTGIASFSKIPAFADAESGDLYPQPDADSSDIEVSVYLKNLATVPAGSKLYLDISSSGVPLKKAEIAVSDGLAEGNSGVTFFFKDGDIIDLNAKMFNSTDLVNPIFAGLVSKFTVSATNRVINIVMNEPQLLSVGEFVSTKVGSYPVIEEILINESTDPSGSLLIKFQAFVSDPNGDTLTCLLSYKGTAGGLTIKTPSQNATNGSCYSELLISLEGSYDVQLKVSDGTLSTIDFKNFSTAKVNMVLNEIPDITVDKLSFSAVRNSKSEFAFKIWDDGNNRCLSAGKAPITLSVYSSHDNYKTMSPLTLDAYCKGSIMLPDVISTINYIFIYTDIFNLYGSTESTVTLVNL